MKKIVLKSLAITLSAISLLNVSPINALDDNKIDEPQITQQLPEKDITPAGNPDLVEELKFWSKVLGIEIVVGAGVLALTRVILEKRFHYIIERIRNEELEKFKGHIGPNILTKRQEGQNWDWLACLQALLKDRGIEKSQEELFKGITGRSPGWFETTRVDMLKETRDNSLLLDFLNRDMDFNAAQKYISKEFNLSLCYMCYKRIQVTEDNTDDICNSIKNVYERNNKKPFAICDSLKIWTKGLDVSFMQMVNVVKIQDDYITIESPLTGLRRTEKIYDFVKRYNEKTFFKDRGILLFGLS